MAPVGAVVSIYYDGWQALAVGDGLRTPSGRTYVIVGLRVQKRGRHLGRRHLACAVVEAAPPGAVVHPLYWYPRVRKRQTLRGVAALRR